MADEGGEQAQAPPPEPRGKITLVEGIIMVMITLSADLIEVILTFFGLNPLSIVIDVPVTFIIQFWLMMKGSKWTWALAGNLIEFIPYLDFLPIRTGTLLITIYLSNHQKVTKLAAISHNRATLAGLFKEDATTSEVQEVERGILATGSRPQSPLSRPIASIPDHEEGYMYHGTTQPWASQIAETGLVPRPQQSWHDLYADIGDNPLLYFSDHPEYASEWADDLAQQRSREPMLLRVPSSYSEGVSSYDDTHLSTKAIPPEDVQAWNGSQWVAMKHMAYPDLYDESGQGIPYEQSRNIKPVKYNPKDPLY